MDGLGGHMVDLTRVGVPEQQRHPTFALAALGGAVWPKGRFGLADAAERGGRPRPNGKTLE